MEQNIKYSSTVAKYGRALKDNGIQYSRKIYFKDVLRLPCFLINSVRSENIEQPCSLKIPQL